MYHTAAAVSASVAAATIYALYAKFFRHLRMHTTVQ
jgi:hypothetical protein